MSTEFFVERTIFKNILKYIFAAPDLLPAKGKTVEFATLRPKYALSKNASLKGNAGLIECYRLLQIFSWKNRSFAKLKEISEFQFKKVIYLKILTIK